MLARTPAFLRPRRSSYLPRPLSTISHPTPGDGDPPASNPDRGEEHHQSRGDPDRGPEGDRRLGVLAFGDSITNGGGELQWGVALQSWALWTARGLGLPYTGYAADGAQVADVVAAQMPAFEARTARPDARYDLGCLYIGVNDVRSVDWDRDRFHTDFRRALSFLKARCDRVLTVTAPLDLGRPRAGAKVRDLNRTVEQAAAELGALVVDLSDFRARNHVMTDHVHPTAFGQIAIAHRALRTLAENGLSIAVWPAQLISYETSWWSRLRGDSTYLYRHAKVSAWALLVVVRLRLIRGLDALIRRPTALILQPVALMRRRTAPPPRLPRAGGGPGRG